MIDVPYDLVENPTSSQIRLSRRKIIKKTLGANLILLFVLIVVVITFIFYPKLLSQTVQPFIGVEDYIIFFLIAGIVLFSLSINTIYQYIYYKTYYYNIKNDVLIIRKGVLRPDEIIIPYNRIQDIYVDRDTMDLLLGLYDVHVSSATVQSGKDAHIDGVKNENATKLKEMIIEKVQGSSNKDTGL